MEIEDTRNAWTVDITELGDIYDLFGKSQKFPAIVAKKLGEHRKRIDSGELELGVQREGYHEYKINGDKFETRFHVRVVPLDENVFSIYTKSLLHAKNAIHRYRNQNVDIILP